MTAPLTPPDCDLRGLLFMPLEVLRLRDSDLASLATGDEFKASVLLWCAAWHQTPAGSLPDDDRVLNRHSGLDTKAWRKARVTVMGEWVKCDDGRLYHPVVAEKALEAWEERQKYRQKREQDRERLSNWRGKKQTKSAGGNADETSFIAVAETHVETSKTVEGREGNSSEASASDGGAIVIEPGRECWRMAKALLRERDGLSEEAAGKFFGHLLSEWGVSAADLFPAVAKAAVNGTEDARSYLTASAKGVVDRHGVSQLTPAEKSLRSNIQ